MTESTQTETPAAADRSVDLLKLVLTNAVQLAQAKETLALATLSFDSLVANLFPESALAAVRMAVAQHAPGLGVLRFPGRTVLQLNGNAKAEDSAGPASAEAAEETTAASMQ